MCLDFEVLPESSLPRLI
jgi:hypothetical protein